MFQISSYKLSIMFLFMNRLMPSFVFFSSLLCNKKIYYNRTIEQFITIKEYKNNIQLNNKTIYYNEILEQYITTEQLNNILQ